MRVSFLLSFFSSCYRLKNLKIKSNPAVLIQFGLVNLHYTNMDNREEALKALLNWVSSYDFMTVPHSSVEDLSDGVALFEFMEFM